MRDPLLRLLSLSFAIVLSACNRIEPGALAASGDTNAASTSAPSEGNAVKIAKESLPYLEVQPVAKDATVAAVRAPGRVAFRDGAVAEVAAPIQGRVASIQVRVGDRVKAGDALVTLQSPDAAASRASLDAALVAKRAAAATLERQASMLQKGVGIESDEFQAEIEVAKNEAEVARAQRAVAFLGQGSGSTVVVRAPIDGTILQRKTSVGAAADPNGEALIQIGDPAALWVVADVFERDLAEVKPGASATVELATMATPVHGKVASVGTVLSTGTRTAPVFIVLDEPVASLRVGMFARASIASESLDGVTLPVSSVLIKDGKKSVVYVAKDEQTFVQREVRVGPPVDGRLQVLSGLVPGERVVLRGALLIDGAADQLL